MTSLVLFIDGLPTSFSIHKKAEHFFVLLPKENPYDSIPPKKIEVTREGNTWLVSGTEDPDIVAQIIEDFNRWFT